MTAVTFPPSVGGDGSTVSDDANATTGLANGGHRTRFVPALGQVVAVAQNAVNSAATASAQAATALNAPGTQATTTTSLTIGSGSKSFTLAQTGKAFAVGLYVQIVSTANTANFMVGAITAFNAGSGAMTVNVIQTNGAGTFASWAVGFASPPEVPAQAGNSGKLLTTDGTLLSWTSPQFFRYSYDNRGNLRSFVPTSETFAVVEGLGLFAYFAGSTEPDDDESSFATASGRWLIEAATWDLIDAWQMPEAEYLVEWDVGEAARTSSAISGAFTGLFDTSFNAKILSATVTSVITSVTSLTQTSFTATVTGSAVGDAVVATPPNALDARISVFARVTSANTVTVYLNNPSASNATIATGTWQIKVIKA